ncbi:hypothetical protein OKW24_002875 [Peribacillus simplex]|nr:hypothetical protein [Peribacillus simplex]
MNSFGNTVTKWNDDHHSLRIGNNYFCSLGNAVSVL